MEQKRFRRGSDDQPYPLHKRIVIGLSSILLNMRTWSNNSVIFTSGTIAGVVLALGISVFAWTGPTATPPNGNVSAPVNVGTTDQVKNGGLGVNSLAVFGNSILSGTDRYLNFGTTAGTNGYGIRDSGGTIQVKNSGGTWANIGGGNSQWVTNGSEIYYAGGNVGIGVTDPTRELDVAGAVSATVYYDRGYPSYYIDASHTSQVYQLKAASLCFGSVCRTSWTPQMSNDFYQECASSWANGQFGVNGTVCKCPTGSIMTGIHFYAYDHGLYCRTIQ